MFSIATQGLKPHHLRELQASCINDAIIHLNFQSLEGDEAYEPIIYALPDSERRNDGRLRNKWMKRYSHLDEGGWYCEGIDGWGCLKPDTPRQYQDGDKVKTIKYEHPPKTPTRIFRPKVSYADGLRLAQQHGLEADYRQRIHPETKPNDEDPSFWDWVKAHPDISITITEGAKKTAAGLSNGIITIGLPGVNGGYLAIRDDRDRTIDHELRSDLESFCQPGREFVFAFDNDEKPSTVERVNNGISTTARLLIERGCAASVMTWQQHSEKGLDDLIAAQGVEECQRLYEARQPLTQWENTESYLLNKARRKQANPLDQYQPNLRVNVPCLTSIRPESLPSNGVIVIHSGLGTGKTKLIREIISGHDAVLAPGHRISLQEGLANRLNLDYLGNCDKGETYILGRDGQPTERIALCWDSILSIPYYLYPDGNYILVVDEADQGFKHLLMGATCGKSGMRPGLIKRAVKFIRGARLVVAASGTLSDTDIDLICAIRGEQAPFLLTNDYQGNRYPVTLYRGESGVDGSHRRNRGAVVAQLTGRIETGERLILCTDQKRVSRIIEKAGLRSGLKPKQILRIDQDTSGDERQRAFLGTTDKVSWLKQNGIRLVIHSPSMSSGVSIEGEYFDAVFGIFEGKTISPDDALQQLARVRKPIPRITYTSAKGMPDRIRETNPKAYAEKYQKRGQLFEHLTQRIIPTDDDQNPIIDYIATTQARRNEAMLNFGFTLQAVIERAGHTVEVGDPSAIEGADTAAGRWRAWEEQVRTEEREAILNSGIITIEHAQELRDKRILTREEALELERFEVCDFYKRHPETLTLKDIQHDQNGRTRQRVSRLENLLYVGLAVQKDTKKWDKLTTWKTHVLPHDLPPSQVNTEAAKAMNVAAIINLAIEATESGEGWNDSTPWVKEKAQHLRQRADDIYEITGLNLNNDPSDVATIGKILRHFAFKTTSKRPNGGGRQRVYRLDDESLNNLKALLQRRAASVVSQGVSIPSTLLSNHLLGGADVDELTAIQQPSDTQEYSLKMQSTRLDLPIPFYDGREVVGMH